MVVLIALKSKKGSLAPAVCLPLRLLGVLAKVAAASAAACVMVCCHSCTDEAHQHRVWRNSESCMQHRP